MSNTQTLLQRIEQLNEIGIALSAEGDANRLLERILTGAQALTGADGGTLYLLREGQLHFAIMQTFSLGIACCDNNGATIALPPIPLHDADGNANHKTVAAHAALSGETINIADVRTAEGFDIEGTLAYDRRTGYHSQSFLTIPMRNHVREIIGVLQLINAQNFNGEVISFSRESQQLAESLASQAAIALSNQQLIHELRELLEKFIEVIADAIDEKSPYTGGHCRRVPELAMLIAEAINNSHCGPLAQFKLDDKALYELRIAALLHDCGKITTPVHIVDKATKLETIFNRIHLVEARIEILKRDAEITLLKAQLDGNHADFEQYQQQLQQLDEELTFLRQCNTGTEFMAQEDQLRVQQIAARQWQCNGETRPLLSDEEIYNLNIAKGTLTAEERQQINGHITTTINMLKALPFPNHLKNVPEIAGGHHERMDGKGYPRGLKREEMSVQARLMGIADIFEALTAADRPYKKAMPISQALTILGHMKEEGHIDPDLFDIFVREKVYLRYAERFLKSEQIDVGD
jgi:HD-GYP domain-containing protein (c-di-GMP phosphodiesterase class II)